MAKTLIKERLATPIGDLTVLAFEGAVVICEFSEKTDRIERQLKQYYPDHEVRDTSIPASIARAFEDYFEGQITALDKLKTSPMGTDYEKAVWERLRQIPAGGMTHYGAIAAEMNSSARAVGRANGRNPISLIHPCHRVIGADGSLTGYAGGLSRKEWLLKHEGAILDL